MQIAKRELIKKAKPNGADEDQEICILLAEIEPNHNDTSLVPHGIVKHGRQHIVHGGLPQTLRQRAITASHSIEQGAEAKHHAAAIRSIKCEV